MISDYSFFYRRKISTAALVQGVLNYDVFVSSYNGSDRISEVYNNVRAKRKIWFIQPEYRLTPLEMPQDCVCVSPESFNEMEQVNDLVLALGDIRDKDLCLDVTGFMRHTLIFLMAKISMAGVREIKVLYSEPQYYSAQEDTVFSTVTSGVVRPVMGMGGSYNASGKEYLILGVGYDHRLISEVVNNKDSSKIYPLFSFPSLSPDMYQQSAVRSSESGDAVFDRLWDVNRYFSPANDPFSTASVINEMVSSIEQHSPEANLYLSPLATKVQALAFAIFWIRDRNKYSSSVSVILPECEEYAKETGVGLKKLWEYVVEF
ncbi:hypothetical protein ACOJCM_08040 [Billgrantia sp. LNSP4103-1]|uniref:hypothetical protein n=1 Tax=Billgrantia sp. LNSP4103-1 TaxID=3410266 RepID=UPI00403F6E9E